MAKAFVSKAQIERCKQLVADGVVTQKSFDESMALTKDPENLPERIHPKKEKAPKKDEEGSEAA